MRATSCRVGRHSRHSYRRCGVWVLLVVIVMGCTNDQRDSLASTGAGPAEVPALGHEATPSSLPEPVPAAQDASGSPEPVERGRLTRSASGVVPFSPADYFLSDTIRRGRLSLDDSRLWGPFRGNPPDRVELESEVFDLCNNAQAFEAITGQEYQEGDLFPENSYSQLEFERPRMGCDGNPVDADRAIPRWALRTNDWGGTIRFLTREAATDYQRQHIAAFRGRNANTVDGFAVGLDNNGADISVLIRFADAGAALDAVRLLDGSVTVAGGTLRGMVRNWSRTQWAYEVSVTAHGRTFEWPLSVQPGELAPFQITSWNGPIDPDGINLLVSAKMVPEADLSRSFSFSFGRSWRGNANDIPGGYPQHILDALPPDGSHEIWRSWVEFSQPVSHPWFSGSSSWSRADHRDSLINQIRFDDLRAYVAFFTYSYDFENYDHVRPSVPILLDLHELVLLSPLAAGGYGEVSKWPIWRIDRDWQYARDPQLTTVFHVPNGFDDPRLLATLGVDPEQLDRGLNWTVWIGAAHSGQESG